MDILSLRDSRSNLGPSARQIARPDVAALRLCRPAASIRVAPGVAPVATRQSIGRGKHGRKICEKAGKPTQEVAWHVTSLSPEDLGCGGDACVEKLAGHVRAHWCVEVYHGKRDNGCHEDKLTRRLDLNIMSAMMVARSLGM